jgi:hypothetical protein
MRRSDYALAEGLEAKLSEWNGEMPRQQRDLIATHTAMTHSPHSQAPWSCSPVAGTFRV